MIDLKKLNLKDEQIEKISNMEFKKENLGALEFDLKVTDSTFEEKDVHFRLERIPLEVYLRTVSKENIGEIAKETLKNFIALPIEARELNFFTFDNDALNILTQLVAKFQTTPILFK